MVENESLIGVSSIGKGRYFGLQDLLGSASNPDDEGDHSSVEAPDQAKPTVVVRFGLRIV